MTPAEFLIKWRDNPSSERAGAQAFFLDLCELLGVEKPNDPDRYCFERGATRTGAGRGWADVWKRDCFAWENKAPGKDLAAALKQLMTYALALDNPPLLVVSDRQIIQIHTHFTGMPSEVHTVRLEEIGLPANLAKLRWLFAEPDRFRPRRTDRDITLEAAGRFADIARALEGCGHDPRRVAHFLIQCLFCMFAEDVGLLPEHLFERIVEKSAGQPDKLSARLTELFASMRGGGEFLLEDIPWFNGGLFETAVSVPLTTAEIAALLAAAKLDWSPIEPSIFGTLFERGLDPALRSQLGANFTDPDTIRKIVDPVVVEPLAAEWGTVKVAIAGQMAEYRAGGKGAKKAYRAADERFLGFLERLKNFRVLDPACGSGNFLYLALRALKDLEHRANLDAEALGLHRQLSIEVCPRNVLGIELNPYAAELARVTVWIGEIQWMLKHGYDIRRNPILAPLDHIECRDAVLNVDDSEPDWPEANAIIGNPPFLGDKKMRGELGDEYAVRLRQLYRGRVPGGADLVTYWFEKARAHIEAGRAKRAGLVATQSIRKGASRAVLDRIVASGEIFAAWSDEPWINDGAAVRVSLVCFGAAHPSPSGRGAGGEGATLDGQPVATINADLTAGENDLTRAARLAENAAVCFQGPVKVGAFDIPGELARQWLEQPNPHGKPNRDIVRPWANGMDITRRPSDTWIIDFGGQMTESEAALYEAPFAYVLAHVKPEREQNRRALRAKNWWRHGEIMPSMRAALARIPRYIATPRVAKHRLFVWLHSAVLPDSRLYVIARADDATFGVLHSRIHQVWALANASRHGVGNDPTYNAATCFEAFPFPPGLQPNRNALTPGPSPEGRGEQKGEGLEVAAIAEAARRLNELRENWLNPPQWVDRAPEIVPGYPDRLIPKPEFAAELKKRTLTNLYNARPAWLDQAHRALDAAVAAAYGWDDDTPALPDDEILRRLLALNRERVGAGS